MCSLSLKPYFQEIDQHSTYQELPAQSFQRKKSALNNKNSIYLPHPLHTDMPNSEGYAYRGETTIITATGRIFSLHHSATISYHFDKIFTPNVLEMTLLSNDVKLLANDWTFLKLSAVEREIDNIFCEISSLMTENIKFTPFYFHINLCMQCQIICRSSVKIS